MTCCLVTAVVGAGLALPVSGMADPHTSGTHNELAYREIFTEIVTLRATLGPESLQTLKELGIEVARIFPTPPGMTILVLPPYARAQDFLPLIRLIAPELRDQDKPRGLPYRLP